MSSRVSTRIHVELSVFTVLTTLSALVDGGFGKSKHEAVSSTDVKF